MHRREVLGCRGGAWSDLSGAPARRSGPLCDGPVVGAQEAWRWLH
jgi:hypothetical protein